jgi:hypothetical protein
VVFISLLPKAGAAADTAEGGLHGLKDGSNETGVLLDEIAEEVERVCSVIRVSNRSILVHYFTAGLIIICVRIAGSLSAEGKICWG